MTVPGDRARVTVAVAVEPAAAFEVFTREIDLWWRRGPAYRQVTSGGVVCIEQKVGGRVLETAGDGRVFERGRVTLWEPPRRLVLEWRGANFVEGETTRVDVLFEPTEQGTRVTLEHSGWSALRPGHPARHGLEGPAFTNSIGRWWGGLLSAMQHRIAEHRSKDGDP